jgi:hypothetical protein
LNIDEQGGSFPSSIEAANSSCAGAADAVPIVKPVATDRSKSEMMITSEFFIVVTFLINSNFSD